MSEKQIKKIILAYSGGLDTTVILHWLKDQYDAEVIAFTADIGQDHDPELVRDRAASIGASKIIIEDLKEEFTKEYIFPMFKANTLYEGEYLLGTSIARPLISKRLVEIAEEEGADAIAHGATGKGNDQIRFEIGSYSLNPEIQVICSTCNYFSNYLTTLQTKPFPAIFRFILSLEPVGMLSWCSGGLQCAQTVVMKRQLVLDRLISYLLNTAVAHGSRDPQLTPPPDLALGMI